VLVSRTHRDGDIGLITSSTSPKLTGSLDLRLIEGIQSIADQLLYLPDGVNFTKITVPWLSHDNGPGVESRGALGPLNLSTSPTTSLVRSLRLLCPINS
jgi:hypothetical protein